MDLVKLVLPGSLLNLKSWRLDLLLHLHPLHFPPEWQGQSQVEIDIRLLGKHACCICDRLDCGHSLYEGLVGEPWSLITLGKLKGCSWSRLCEVALIGEV